MVVALCLFLSIASRLDLTDCAGKIFYNEIHSLNRADQPTLNSISLSLSILSKEYPCAEDQICIPTLSKYRIIK